MEKWYILFAVWFIFAFCFFLTHWIYAKEDHLVWCNDYDVIESLQGEARTKYIEVSKRATYHLFFRLMIITSLPFLLPSSTTLWILMAILMLAISIYSIYKDFKLRKQYLNK